MVFYVFSYFFTFPETVVWHFQFHRHINKIMERWKWGGSQQQATQLKIHWGEECKQRIWEVITSRSLSKWKSYNRNRNFTGKGVWEGWGGRRSEGWRVSGFLMLPFTDKSWYHLERQREASCFHAVLVSFFILFCCRPSMLHLGSDWGWMDTSWEDEINREEWVEREEEDRGARVGRECEREEIRTLTERKKERKTRMDGLGASSGGRKLSVKSKLPSAAWGIRRSCGHCSGCLGTWPWISSSTSPLGAEQRGRGHTAAALTFYWKLRRCYDSDWWAIFSHNNCSDMTAKCAEHTHAHVSCVCVSHVSQVSWTKRFCNKNTDISDKKDWCVPW